MRNIKLLIKNLEIKINLQMFYLFLIKIKRILKKLISEAKEIYLGDIIINYKKMDSKSLNYLMIKFNILWIHGLLHLLAMIIKKILILKNEQYEKKLLKKLINVKIYSK